MSKEGVRDSCTTAWQLRGRGGVRGGGGGGAV